MQIIDNGCPDHLIPRETLCYSNKITMLVPGRKLAHNYIFFRIAFFSGLVLRNHSWALHLYPASLLSDLWCANIPLFFISSVTFAGMGRHPQYLACSRCHPSLCSIVALTGIRWAWCQSLFNFDSFMVNRWLSLLALLVFVQNDINHGFPWLTE